MPATYTHVHSLPTVSLTLCPTLPRPNVLCPLQSPPFPVSLTSIPVILPPRQIPNGINAMFAAPALLTKHPTRPPRSSNPSACSGLRPKTPFRLNGSTRIPRRNILLPWTSVQLLPKPTPVPWMDPTLAFASITLVLTALRTTQLRSVPSPRVKIPFLFPGTS